MELSLADATELLMGKKKRAKKTTKNKASKKKTKQARRTFSDAQKKKILAEVDSAGRGEKAAVIEKHGLFPAQVSQWRKQLGAASPARGGKKAAKKKTSKRRGRPRGSTGKRASRASGGGILSDYQGAKSALLDRKRELEAELKEIEKALGS